MEYYNKFKINENEILGGDNINIINNENIKEKESEDSLEINNEENNTNIINDNNKENTSLKKFKTFKEQRNAANKKNNINELNKDNNIFEDYNEEKEKEVDIESLLSVREKYLKEIEDIKKGLQQK